MTAGVKLVVTDQAGLLLGEFGFERHDRRHDRAKRFAQGVQRRFKVFARDARDRIVEHRAADRQRLFELIHPVTVLDGVPVRRADVDDHEDSSSRGRMDPALRNTLEAGARGGRSHGPRVDAPDEGVSS